MRVLITKDKNGKERIEGVLENWKDYKRIMKRWETNNSSVHSISLSIEFKPDKKYVTSIVKDFYSYSIINR